MKVCSNPQCPHHGGAQPESEFHKHKRHSDGLCSHCKTCAKIKSQSEARKEAVAKYNDSAKAKACMLRYERSAHGKEHRAEYREEHYDRYMQLWRAYNHSEAGAVTTQKYHQTEKWRTVARYHARKQRLLHPNQWQARLTVRRAIIHNDLPRLAQQKCTDCGQQAVNYHHHLGYAPEHWLDVVPLCRKCHRARHVNAALAQIA
jgi:hypothetical protein